MKVSTLQQFLHSLLSPLEASAASAQTLAGLQHACQGLNPFLDKDLAEFAEFLDRAADYEREGKWPSVNPPINGHILDEPSAPELARRLRTFLEREVPSESPIPDDVRAEMHRLIKRLKPAQLKEMARELQIDESFRNVKQGIEKLVFRLTGQSLSGKRSRSPRREPVQADPAVIQQHADELRSLVGKDDLQQRVQALVGQLSGTTLKALAEQLGTARKARRKGEWNAILLAALKAAPAESREAAPSEGKIARLAEIVSALKAKADGPDAPTDEIEAELRSVEEQMDRDEAIAVAQKIGVVRPLGSCEEAVEEIRHKVFEMKRARESIAY
ncbi:MAG TPA: hypothetical protein VMG10_03120 [Gemmataceae bacterium]|nr:hypothetical protein [Gemmataceae bacterium]